MESDKEKVLEEKKIQFRNIKSFQQKLAFWMEEFNVNYLDYVASPNEDAYQKLWDFRLGQEEGKERRELNEWLLENIPKVYTQFRSLSLKELKKELNKELAITREKRKILVAKKREIDESFVDVSKGGGVFKIGQYFISSKFPADYEAFKRSAEDNEEPDYSKEYPSSEIYRVQNGYILGQFRRYIVSEIEKLDSANETVAELEIDQIALLLDLVGALDGMNCDTTDKARIFSGLLKVNFKDLYDAMRNVRGKEIRKNKVNLKEILYFLEEKEVKAFKKEIQEEHNKLT